MSRLRSTGMGVVCGLLACSAAASHSQAAPPSGKDGEGKGVYLRLGGRTLVLDGAAIHNIGELQMNVTNFGFLGSLPKSRYPMSDFPSAQWPAGSGIEYLYAAGVWIAAVKNGIPSVSTGFPENEFYPGEGPLDIVYEAWEGKAGGERYPSPIANDDGDTLWTGGEIVDEDWLNGRDDDGDGLVDEDYAAYGNQMFSCWYRDDLPVSRLVWPEHTPLGLEVRQESFQWGDDPYKNFIVVRYTVTNSGDDYLTDIYYGVFADVDAGPRFYGNYQMDDRVDFWTGTWCGWKDTWEWPVELSVAYAYDNDGDGGRTPGYFGIMMYPQAISTCRYFRGLQPYVNGGEPENDADRYQALSKGRIDRTPDGSNDYKILVAGGPVYVLPPGQSFEFYAVFLCGEGLEGMLDTAANAAVAFEGVFYDYDGNPKTGRKGRETMLIGPIEFPFDPDPCDGEIERVTLAKSETLWVNGDCFDELWHWERQGCFTKYLADKAYFQTGVDGREHRLVWTTATAPIGPYIRVAPGDGRVDIYWDNASEKTPDLISGEYDFEGYQIWRARDWHRPIGTDERTGPPGELWALLESRDLANGVLPDIEFRHPETSGGWLYEPCSDLPDREALIEYLEQCLQLHPTDSVPCPAVLSAAQCDTLVSIARFNLHMEGGKRYYRFIDRDVHNGLPYFYSVVAYDHTLTLGGDPKDIGFFSRPQSNFVYTSPRSAAQESGSFDEREVYVVPNPATSETMAAWRLGPNNRDPSGWKVEFRNLPACRCTIRIFTVSGDLVQTLQHDGRDGSGTAAWNLLSRNGQDITSGVYLFSVDPEGGGFPRVVGKFVVVR